MRPGSYPLALYRGDTYAWVFRLWSDDAKTVPLDMVGVTAKAEIRNMPGGQIIMALPCAVTQPNIIDVVLTVDLWADWTLRSAVWDLQLTYPDTSVFTVLAGPVTVDPDVTDSTPISTRGAR